MADDTITPIENAPFARVGTDTGGDVSPVPLSDGTVIFAGSTETQQQIAAKKAAAENEIAQEYMKKAAAQNAPFAPTKPDGTPGDMIYSGTQSYQNNPYGQMAAGIDHLGGNAINRYIDPTGQGPFSRGGGITGAAGRVLTQGAVGAAAPFADPILAGLSIAKSHLDNVRSPGQILAPYVGMTPRPMPGEPGADQFRSRAQRLTSYLLGPGEQAGPDEAPTSIASGLRRWANTPETPDTAPEATTLSGLARSDLGMPELAPDASWLQRVTEAGASAGTSRVANAVLPAGRTTADIVAGQAGQTAAQAAANDLVAGALPAMQSAGTTALNAVKNVGKDFGWSALGTTVSDIAGRWGGDVPSYLAGLLFSGSVPYRNIGRQMLVSSSRAEPPTPTPYGDQQVAITANTPRPPPTLQAMREQMAATAAIGDGLPGAYQRYRRILDSTTGLPENDVTEGAAHPDAAASYQAGRAEGWTPGFRSLANPTWQRINTIIGNVPSILGIGGGPTANAIATDFANIERTRNQSANAIAGGPGSIPAGMDVTPESIGQPLLQGARDAIPRVRAQQDALYAPIHAQMGNTEVDVSPVLSELNQMTAGNQLPPNQEAALRGLVNNLTSVAPGEPHYDPVRGQLPPGAAFPQPTMNVPWNMAANWLRSVSASLGPDSPLKGGDVPVLRLKQALTNAMQARAEQQSPGLGQQFRNAREQYAHLENNDIAQLSQVAGEEGPNGTWKSGSSGQAYNYLTSNLQSPENLTHIARHLGPYWNAAAGRFIATLGGQRETFRPDNFSKAWRGIGPQVRTMLTGGEQGAPEGFAGFSEPHQRLENAAQVGSNFAPPVSRTGLQAAAATGAAVGSGISKLGTFIGTGFLPVTWGLSHAMESPETRRLMGGGTLTPQIAEQVYSGLPRFVGIEDSERRRQQAGKYPGSL